MSEAIYLHVLAELIDHGADSSFTSFSRSSPCRHEHCHLVPTGPMSAKTFFLNGESEEGEVKRQGVRIVADAFDTHEILVNPLSARYGAPFGSRTAGEVRGNPWQVHQRPLACLYDIHDRDGDIGDSRADDIGRISHDIGDEEGCLHLDTNDSFDE